MTRVELIRMRHAVLHFQREADASSIPARGGPRRPVTKSLKLEIRQAALAGESLEKIARAYRLTVKRVWWMTRDAVTTQANARERRVVERPGLAKREERSCGLCGAGFTARPTSKKRFCGRSCGGKWGALSQRGLAEPDLLQEQRGFDLEPLIAEPTCAPLGLEVALGLGAVGQSL